MKKLNLLIIMILVGFASLSSCKKKCSGEDPTAKVLNAGRNKVSVQIKTTGGSTTNINNIEPNMASSEVSYAPGAVTFTVTIGNSTIAPVVNTFDMASCYDYTIRVDSNNVVTSLPTQRNP